MEIKSHHEKSVNRCSAGAGFTLLEALIYISLLVVIVLVAVNTMLSFASSYRQLGALRVAEHAGMDAMDRMTRDIRAAASVNAAQSSLGSDPGMLTLVNTGTTTKFYVQNGVIKVDVNGTYSGPLTISNASVMSLIFTELSNANTSAVKVDMTVTGTAGPVTKTKTYHATVIMKGA